MRLYVCHGMFLTPRPSGDPCANAHSALAEAGHDAMWAQAHPVA